VFHVEVRDNISQHLCRVKRLVLVNPGTLDGLTLLGYYTLSVLKNKQTHKKHFFSIHFSSFLPTWQRINVKSTTIFINLYKLNIQSIGSLENLEKEKIYKNTT